MLKSTPTTEGTLQTINRLIDECEDAAEKLEEYEEAIVDCYNAGLDVIKYRDMFKDLIEIDDTITDTAKALYYDEIINYCLRAMEIEPGTHNCISMKHSAFLETYMLQWLEEYEPAKYNARVEELEDDRKGAER